MPAESTLSAAVENGYRQFAAYGLRGPLEACPCCIDPTEKRVLETVPLRQLTAEQLQRYAFKAMTTWGNAADFCHFLPRILELKATEEIWAELFVLLGKLTQAGYATWPAARQRAVRQLLLEWAGFQWHRSILDLDELGELLRFLGGIAEILPRLTVSYEDMSFENLATFAAQNLSELNALPAGLVEKGFTPAVVSTLNQWFRQQLPTLEAGFFHWAEAQPALAQLAAEGYDFVHRLPPDKCPY